MKPIIITLLYLAGGNIEQDRFEIFMSCSGWYKTNVTIYEKKKTFFSNHYYYKYKNKKIIGYVCAGEEPR